METNELYHLVPAQLTPSQAGYATELLEKDRLTSGDRIYLSMLLGLIKIPEES